MSRLGSPALSRRTLLQLGGALALAHAARPALAAAPANEFTLTAAPARAPLVGGDVADTAVWAYDGRVPGPEIRVQQGERLRIQAVNRLAEDTTIHWHGVRTPNAMDGVPDLTQRPIAPGETFAYEFDAVDAGTFWYHPHQRSAEQVGRGLYGPLIVEEPDPIRVDRDLVWVLDDWRLTRDAAIRDDFGNRHDAMHDGRVGNTVTINGRVPDSFALRVGERIRLRLINAANARIFRLDFGPLAPVVVALDGQPVAPHAPEDNGIVIGPAMRVDLVIDVIGRPGERVTVVDRFYEGLEYRLIDLVHDDERLRDRVPDWPIDLVANPLPEPDIGAATRHEIVFNGGMMGGMMNGGGSMMSGMRGDGIWSLNGVAATGHVMEPLLTLRQGESCVLSLANDTAWRHPMHLHGHSFRVITRDGAPTRHREWRDTVLMAPNERVDIAFVADNPGDWMFHCHILEHQAAGMMGVIRVAPETKA